MLTIFERKTINAPPFPYGQKQANFSNKFFCFSISNAANRVVCVHLAIEPSYFSGVEQAGRCLQIESIMGVEKLKRPIPRVSIGVPVYNGGAILETSLDSLLAQTYTDFELIISDNGSTDNTADICRAYAARDSRIRYFRYEENRGAAWNFNNVFHLARGTYFKWAAGDDICAPAYLARCVAVLDQNPQVVWCHSRSKRIDPLGHFLPPPNDDEVSYVDSDSWVHGWFDRFRSSAATREAPCPDQRFRSVLLGQHGNFDVFGLIRVAAMRKTSLQLPVYGGDKVFVAELGLMGRYQEIPEVLFFKRILPSGSGALSTASAQQQWIAPTHSARGIRTRLLFAHMKAVWRTPLSVTDRALCFLVIMRYLFQVRKWRTILLKIMRGAGTGGGYLAEARSVPAERRSDAARGNERPADNARDQRSIGA